MKATEVILVAASLLLCSRIEQVNARTSIKREQTEKIIGAPELSFSSKERYGGHRRLLKNEENGKDAVLEQFSILIDGQEIIVDLHPSDILPSTYREQIVTENGELKTINTNTDEERGNCHFQGKVVSSPSSAVAVSTCFGKMKGCILMDDKSFEINHEFGSNETRIRKLGNERMESAIDTILKTPYRLKQDSNSENENQRSKQTRSLPQNLYIEVVLVSDPDRIGAFLTMGQLTEANVAVMNQVAAYFSRLSIDDLGVSIGISLAGQVYWSQSPIEDTRRAESLLTETNNWRNANYEILIEHDTLILLSGLDFSGDTIGLAELGSICDDTSRCHDTDEGVCKVNQFGETLGCCSRRSTAIVQAPEFSSVMTAETVAHEIGHQLSFVHDSPGTNGCSSSEFIMASIANAVPDSGLEWGPCAKEQFQSIYSSASLASGYHSYGCLANVPGETLTEFLSAGSKNSMSIASLLLLVSIQIIFFLCVF